MESWQFIQSPAGEWYWLCSNVISRQTRTSTSTFKTRMECVANAMGAGYQKVAPAAAPAARQLQPPRAEAAPAKRAKRRNRNKSGRRGKSN